jgi:hypothetical protein
MATNASPFIVNIVPLQNLASDIRGTDATTVLQAQVANLQAMVDTTNHIIYADAFSNFTPGRAIEFYADINLSNVGLYTNSNTVTLNTSTTSPVIISNTPTVQRGQTTTNAGASTSITFVSTFTSIPSIAANYIGYNPVYLTLDKISVSSFTAYSWSNNVKVPTAAFNWQATL